MKKLLIVSSVLLGFAALVAGTGMSTQANAAPRCDATSVGPRGQAFEINGNTATVKFKVTGSQNCKVQLSSISFYAPSMDGRPYNQQIKYAITTKTYGPGSYSMSVALPPSSTKQKGCFYQVDLSYGTYVKTPVIAYGHGKVPCGEKPPVTPPTPPVVKIEVCELATKKRITINESEFDSTKHTKNFDLCKETPVTPPTPPVTPPTPPVTPPETPEVPQTPPELPETGPAAAMMQLFGAGSMVASAAYYVQSRRS